jgi:hypothetical protein
MVAQPKSSTPRAPNAIADDTGVTILSWQQMVDILRSLDKNKETTFTNVYPRSLGGRVTSGELTLQSAIIIQRSMNLYFRTLVGLLPDERTSVVAIWTSIGTHIAAQASACAQFLQQVCSPFPSPPPYQTLSPPSFGNVTVLFMFSTGSCIAIERS